MGAFQHEGRTPTKWMILVGPGYSFAAWFWNVASDAWFRKVAVASVWRASGLILKYCVWHVILKHCAWCPTDASQTQHFEIRRQTQHFKIMCFLWPASYQGCSFMLAGKLECWGNHRRTVKHDMVIPSCWYGVTHTDNLVVTSCWHWAMYTDNMGFAL